MSLTRRIARPLLAAVFVNSGIDTLRNPGPRVARAEPLTPKLTETLPVPDDTEQLVKVNAGVQVVAGVFLALGWFPRLAAAALAGSLVPTTLAGHPFWEESDPAARAGQQTQFLKNAGLLGGLVLAMFDTEGEPSIAWRTKNVAGRARRRAAEAKESLPVG
jgi:uncharacterized membrane protein YphA (DoxX/SURF4 family)